MNPRIKPVAQTIAALVLLPAFALAAQGQARSRPDPVQRELQRQLQQEMMERALEEGPRDPVERDRRLAVEQIREDYMRIQVVNNELVLAAMRGGVLDLKLVTKTSAEIRKRAERLRHNLVLPEPDKAAERARAEAGDEEARLRASVLALGKLVAGFVRNPIFREVKVVDAQSAVRARRDLEEIIELSGEVKKGSEKLNKEARKSN